MQHPSYSKRTKSLDYRIGELVQSLSVIRDSLQLLERGHPHQILPIAGQLRALLTDRATPPLLVALSQSLEVPLNVWTSGPAGGRRGPDQPHPILRFSMEGILLTAEKSFSDQVEVPISEALDSVVLYAHETGFTARDVIAFLANEAGGAHFSEDFPSALGSVMDSVFLGELPAPAQAIRQFGQVVLELGLRVLRKLLELDIDLILAIRQPRTEAHAFLFDAGAGGNRTRYFGKVNPNLSLTFGVRGANGEFAATAQNTTDWNHPHHVRFRHRLDTQLRSRLSVHIDGDIRAEWTLDGPLLAYGVAAGYEVWFNRGHDEPEASCEWALGHFAMSPPCTDPYAEATALLEYREMVTSLEVYRCMSSSEHLREALGDQHPSGATEPIDIQEWLRNEVGGADEADQAPHIT